MPVRKLASVSASFALAGGVLVLGSAAAPSARRPGFRAARPQLVATPRTFAPARALAAGDRIERLVRLHLSGRRRLAAVYFEAKARTSSQLDADPRVGLQVEVDACSKRWRARGKVYSCPGKKRVVLSPRPLLGRAKLRRPGIRPGPTAQLRLVLTLPAQAGNALQAQSTIATYSFIGVSARR